MRRHFMICVGNRGYESSLEARKLYKVLIDKVAGKHHQIRVIDESGEDYLYPEKFFAPIRWHNISLVRTGYCLLHSSSVIKIDDSKQKK